jgi:hypothetical protein
MGRLIRFIHNRDLAAENIVTAYVRQRFLLAAPAGAVDSAIARFKACGLAIAPHSCMQLAHEVMKLRGAAAGIQRARVYISAYI